MTSLSLSIYMFKQTVCCLCTGRWKEFLATHSLRWDRSWLEPSAPHRPPSTPAARPRNPAFPPSRSYLKLKSQVPSSGEMHAKLKAPLPTRLPRHTNTHHRHGTMGGREESWRPALPVPSLQQSVPTRQRAGGTEWHWSQTLTYQFWFQLELPPSAGFQKTALLMRNTQVLEMKLTS